MTQNATRFTTWLATKGITNWVVATRVTDRLRSQYGADVQAISQKRFRELERQYEIETAAQHPALSAVWSAVVIALPSDPGESLGDVGAAVVIAQLRKAGWRIEPVYSERGFK